MKPTVVLTGCTLMLGVTACTSLPSGTPIGGPDYPTAWPAIVLAGPDCGGLRGSYHDVPVDSVGQKYRITQLVREVDRFYGAAGDTMRVTATVTLNPIVSDAKLVVNVDTPVSRGTRTFQRSEQTRMSASGAIQRYAKSVACVDGVLELRYEYSSFPFPLPIVAVRNDALRLYKVPDGLVIGLTEVSFPISSKQEFTWLRYASAAVND